MTRRSIALLLAVTLLLAGCGEREDGDRAERAVATLLRALGDGRADEACAVLSQRGMAELAVAAARRPARPDAETCAAVAGALTGSADELERLRAAPVNRVLVHGDRATVETDAGAFEAEEVKGRWLVRRLGPLGRLLAGEDLPQEPVVHVTVSRPKLDDAALGPALAGRTDVGKVELSGTMAPRDARLRVEATEGAQARRVEARDGRFRVEAELAPGQHELRLTGAAPGHEPTEVIVRLTAEP